MTGLRLVPPATASADLDIPMPPDPSYVVALDHSGRAIGIVTQRMDSRWREVPAWLPYSSPTIAFVAIWDGTYLSQTPSSSRLVFEWYL